MVQRTTAVVPTVGGLFDLIYRKAAVTRSELGSATGLSRTAVTSRVATLLQSGLVVETDDGLSTGGRPPSTLAFHAGAGHVYAAALGRSRAQLAVCDLGGSIIAGTSFDHADGLGPDEILPRVRSTLDTLAAESGVAPSGIRGVGLSIPGTVDRGGRMSLASPIMRGWDHVPLEPYFADLPGAELHVENDANALALSEVHGHLRDHRDLLVLKASTGICCGIFVDGQIVKGVAGAAGEIGHTKCVAADGMVCRCGDIGCLEAVASGWALVQQYRASGHEVAHVRELVALAVEGEPSARRLVRESGRRVGEVLAGVVNLLNPGMIVIGGDMLAAHDTFVAGLRETLYAGASALASHGLTIAPATFGTTAGVVGCAQVAIADALSARSIDALVQQLPAGRPTPTGGDADGGRRR